MRGAKEWHSIFAAQNYTLFDLVPEIQSDARKDLDSQLKEAVDLLEAWEQDTYPATLRAWVRWRKAFLAKIKEGR